MELINVEKVFCEDCEFKDNCVNIICDVNAMPRVIFKGKGQGEWRDVHILDGEHTSMICSNCGKRFVHHTGHSVPYFCPNCGMRMVKYEYA